MPKILPASVEKTIEVIVQTEGPIHKEDIFSRTREFMGYARMGNRIRAYLNSVVDYLIKNEGTIIYLEENYLIANNEESSADIAVRRREKPKIERISNAEIRASVLLVLLRQFATPFDELVRYAALNLGFKSVYPSVYERISGVIKFIENRGDVIISSERVVDFKSKEIQK